MRETRIDVSVYEYVDGKQLFADTSILFIIK